MFRKPYLPVFAAIVLSCSVSFGQAFTQIAPSDLGIGTGSGPITQIFDISSLLGQSAGSVSLDIDNGFVNASNDLWTVSEIQSSTFKITGLVAVEGYVQHGSNLGSEAFANGSLSQDGMTSATGENWTLVSALDSDYTASQSGNDYLVNYTGAETNQLERNAVGFRWVSDQPISEYTVFSSNTTDLNNNYTIAFRAAAVPEPSSALLATLATGLFFIRRKRS